MTKTEPTQPRGRPRSERSRSAILDAVRAQLLEAGYAGLTIEGVAVTAKVSKTTIYRWWSTKGELVLEAAHEDIAIGEVPDSGDARADVGRAIDQLIDTFSRPLASTVIFAAITTGANDPQMAQIFRDRYVHPWRSSAAEALKRAHKAHRGTDVPFLLDVIVGTVFQRTLVLKTPDTEDLKSRLLALVLP